MVNMNRSKPSRKERRRERRRAFNEKIRRSLFWVVQYWRELFNFRFDKYMIIQVIPGVYGIALAAIAFGLIYLCAEAFMHSPWRGLFYFFFAAPITFLVAASVLRALLEFYMVVFKISEHVDELVGLRDTVDRLSGIGDRVDEMVSMTRRIPFWRALTRPPETPTIKRARPRPVKLQEPPEPAEEKAEATVNSEQNQQA